jgi:hypothetical protein
MAAQEFPIDGFEAIEVNGELGAPSEFLRSSDAAVHERAMMAGPSGIPTLRDWFALLNMGKKIAALGNSDTHGRNDGTGWPRSFVYLGTDDPREATGDKLVAAITAQQVTVSHGPFVTASWDGKALAVKVQAASWVDVSTVEVYGNGRPLGLARAGAGMLVEREGGALALPLDPADRKGVVRFDGKVAVKPQRDSWYVVLVRGTRSLAPVAAGTPYAYTNPAYVDLEGDGWTAPGL